MNTNKKLLKNYYERTKERKIRYLELLEKNADGILKLYLKNQYFNNKNSNEILISDGELDLMLLKYYPDIFLEIRDIQFMRQYLNNHYKRNNRLKIRIERLLKYDKPIFGTLTFNDSTLENTTEEQRHRIVKDFLGSNCLEYVANIDYGKKREREHYHFISDSKIDPKKWISKGLGACKFVFIRENSLPLRLAKYLNKFINHSIKKTTKNHKIIYSRKLKKID